MTGPIDVFFSYAPADDTMRAELESHLSRLQRDRVIRTWSARQVRAGEDWKDAVKAQLAGAGIVLLLVSADYLASDYLYEVEATAALGRERAGKARVIPVLLRACDWEIAAFQGLTPLPANKVPVSSWPNRDEAWADVVHGIREAIPGTAASVPLRTRGWLLAALAVLAVGLITYARTPPVPGPLVMGTGAIPAPPQVTISPATSTATAAAPPAASTPARPWAAAPVVGSTATASPAAAPDPTSPALGAAVPGKTIVRAGDLRAGNDGKIRVGNRDRGGSVDAEVGRVTGGDNAHVAMGNVKQPAGGDAGTSIRVITRDVQVGDGGTIDIGNVN